MRSNKGESDAPAELYRSAAGPLPTRVFVGQSANKDVYSDAVAPPSIQSYSATHARIGTSLNTTFILCQTVGCFTHEKEL